MAVPKRRKSRSRSRMNRANKHVVPRSVVLCPACGAATLPHRVCPNCGYYQNRYVVEKEVA